MKAINKNIAKYEEADESDTCDTCEDIAKYQNRSKDTAVKDNICSKDTTKNACETVLTDYGTVIGPKKFELIKNKTVATKIIQFKGLKYTYNLHRKLKISGKDYIQVPRGIAPIKMSIRTSNETWPEGRAVLSLGLHDYQELVVNHSVTALQADQHFLLQMDTGLGKSFVAAGLINKIRMKTCMVVYNKILSQQMEDDLRKAFGDTVTISRKKDKPADIMIIVINTAIKLPREFWATFGLVILDEVHSYCSDTFMEIFWRADFSEYVFGMTATPDRLDRMETVMYKHLGRPVRAESIYKGLESCRPGNFYGRTVRINYSGPAEFTETVKNKNGIMSPVLMAKQFLNDPHRMTLAAKVLMDLYNAGRDIYVFCQTKDPLRTLRRRIVKSTGLSREQRRALKKDIHIVTGDSTQDQTKDAKSSARIFLTTYALSSKGLSLGRFNSLLFLTPMKSNMEQICGRIFRKGSDETIERIIVDIIDVETPIKKQWYKRHQEYMRRNMEVNVFNYSYTCTGIMVNEVNKEAVKEVNNMAVQEVNKEIDANLCKVLNSHRLRDPLKMTSEHLDYLAKKGIDVPAK